MIRRPPRTRFVASAVVLASLVAGFVTFVPTAAESTAGAGLHARVVASNRGPLPPCSGSDCTSSNDVREFIYIENENRLTNDGPARTRAVLPNSFVVGSIDQTVLVNGVATFHYTFAPPPNLSPDTPPAWSGKWIETVDCPVGGTPPCTVVGPPAVVPGEDAAVFFTIWAHGNTEPNGTYVFKYTVHGMQNGTPVNLAASSPPIVMTG